MFTLWPYWLNPRVWIADLGGMNLIITIHLVFLHTYAWTIGATFHFQSDIWLFTNVSSIFKEGIICKMTFWGFARYTSRTSLYHLINIPFQTWPQKNRFTSLSSVFACLYKILSLRWFPPFPAKISCLA